MTWRELRVLITHLPAESHTARAVAGVDEPPWTRTEHLLAGCFDLLRILIWQNENMGRKTKTRRPRPIPRPGIEDETVHYGTPRPLEEVKAILASSRPGAVDVASVEA